MKGGDEGGGGFGKKKLLLETFCFYDKILNSKGESLVCVVKIRIYVDLDINPRFEDTFNFFSSM